MQIEKVASRGIIKIDGVPGTSVIKPLTFDGLPMSMNSKPPPPEKARALVLTLQGEATEPNFKKFIKPKPRMKIKIQRKSSRI